MSFKLLVLHKSESGDNTTGLKKEDRAEPN